MARITGLHGDRGRMLIEIGVLSALILCCVVLGGASRAGFVANALVQTASIAVIAWAIVQRGPRLLAGSEVRLWTLAFAFVALFALQLLPLPYGLWSALPGRGQIAADMRLAGLVDPWMSLSLAPDRTWRALTGVLPALAFVMILPRTRRSSADAVVGTAVAIALLSAMLGLAQAGSGQAATTYLYQITNRGDAVGFFANANHLATLMVASIPLAAGSMAAFIARGKASRRSALLQLLLVPVVVILSAALALTTSRAGIGLLALSLAGSLAIVFGDFVRQRRWLVIVGVLAILVLAAAVVASVVLFDDDRMDGMSRPYMWRTTIDAIRSFHVVGSGFGSFEQIFHLFEDRAAIKPIYANHAHNDLLELTLETGLPGLALLGLFVLWLARNSWAIWTDAARRDPLAQGASLAIILILLHSLVDYPLRTGAMAALFGLCCALVARPARSAVQPIVAPKAAPTARHLSA